MHHFQSKKSAPHVADEAETAAASKGLQMARIEMQKTYAERAAAVFNCQRQGAAGAIDDFGMGDRRLNLRGLAGQQITDGRDAGFVFPAQRKM